MSILSLPPVLFVTAVANAHPFVVYSGSLVATRTHLTIKINADRHTLGHEARAAVEDRGDELRRTNLTVDLTADQWTGTVRFERPRSSDLLTIEHRSGESLGAGRRRFDLALVHDAASRDRVLRLTSGGNYEIFSLTPKTLADFNRFPRPRVKVSKGRDGGTLATVDFPLPLLPYGILELPVIPSRDIAITPVNLRQIEVAFAQWGVASLRLDPASEATLVASAAVGPEDVAISDSNTNPLLVRARAMFRLPPATRRMSWTGFSAGITVLDVYQECDG